MNEDPPRLRGPLIPLLSVLAFVVAAVVGVSVWVTVGNDAAARTVEEQLVAMPLPADTQRLDSMSQAAKVSGNGNGMQYLGAMLIESDLSASELKAFYDGLGEESDLSPSVIATTDEYALSGLHGARGFFNDPGVPGRYIVSAFGHAPSELQEQLDLRGH